MGVIGCQIDRLEYKELDMIIMIESTSSLFSYKSFGEVLAKNLNEDHEVQFIYEQLTL